MPDRDAPFRSQVTMPNTLETKLIDKRVAHRYVQKGRLDEKAYEAHLRSLPDLADQAMPVESDIDGDDFDDEDDLDGLDEPAAAETASPSTGEPPPSQG